jgi:D-aspartate ligase
MQPKAAVVVGGELNGLGVCRSLGPAGVAVYVVDARRSSPAMWSRYGRPVVVPALHGPALLSGLLGLCGKFAENPFLIITNEMALLTISADRDKLEGAFRFRLPAHQTVLLLHNKARFHEFAVSNGLPVPRAEIVRQGGNLAAMRTLRFPVVIKPADKRDFHLGKSPRLIVAVDAERAQEACEQLLETTEEVVVYEWIEGGDNNLYFSLFYRGRNANDVSAFVGRKLASTPPGIGSTAFCTAASQAREELDPITNKLLDRVEYQGFGGIEYKWDRNRRRFVIIEPTVGRTDWQEEIATLCGVNIPLDAYLHEFRLPAVARMPDNGAIVWQASCFDRIRFGSAKIPVGARVVDGYWRTDDPLPAIMHYPYDALVGSYRRREREEGHPSRKMRGARLKAALCGLGYG